MNEHQKTAMFDDMTWLTPVESVDDLPATGIRDHSVCYVKTENAVYRFTYGVWTLDSSVGKNAPTRGG